MNRREFIILTSTLGVICVFPFVKAGAREPDKLLDNEDKEGFYVRFIKPIKPVDPAKWRLKVGGLCENPKTFTLADLKKITKATQTSRMKCVESWSSKAKWGGFRANALFEIVKPKKQAKYLYFYSADDYYEFIPLEELLNPRVIFAYEMNDATLPDEYGAPLRLLMPSKYGYKSVKTILRLDFVEKEGTGYWSLFGYSKDATIQKGTDHALDLNTYKILTREGEPEY